MALEFTAACNETDGMINAAENFRTIPVTLVTGFLGSGKTTAILNFLNDKAEAERVAILVNDFGRIGVDSITLRQRQSSSTVVHRVPGGCICCTAAVGLTLALLNIIETEDPDRIIIEPTGIAREYEIIQLLKSTDFAKRVHLAQVILMVDLRQVANQAQHPNVDFEVRYKEADTIIGNFSDQLDSDQLSAVLKEIEQKLDKTQNLIPAVRARFPVDIFRTRSTRIHARPPSKLRSGTQAHSNSEPVPAHVEAYTESGQQWSDDQTFAFEKLSHAFVNIKTDAQILRIKGQFKTDRGYFHLEWSVRNDQPEWTSIEHPIESNSFVELINARIPQRECDRKLDQLFGVALLKPSRK
jgi:G3E family GTPase